MVTTNSSGCSDSFQVQRELVGLMGGIALFPEQSYKAIHAHEPECFPAVLGTRYGTCKSITTIHPYSLYFDIYICCMYIYIYSLTTQLYSFEGLSLPVWVGQSPRGFNLELVPAVNIGGASSHRLHIGREDRQQQQHLASNVPNCSLSPYGGRLGRRLFGGGVWEGEAGGGGGWEGEEGGG